MVFFSIENSMIFSLNECCRLLSDELLVVSPILFLLLFRTGLFKLLFVTGITPVPAMYLQLDYDDLDTSPLKPDMSQLNTLSETLREKLGLDLFGVDVIIECETQRYAVIDINVFPSMYA